MRRTQLGDLDLAIDIFDQTQSRKNSNEKANFLWFRLLIDVLMKIDESYSIDNIKTEYEQQNTNKYGDHKALSAEEFVDNYISNIPMKRFIEICKHHFEGNSIQLAKLAQFERMYTPSKSLLWYTQEPFIFRVLNKALRKQNIDVLYQYRFLIRDISDQLCEQKQMNEPQLHVYRGQAMANEEFERVTRTKNQFVRFNSFLSTSKDEDIARGFAISSLTLGQNEKLVLFDIEINTEMNDIRPYADISHLSQFPEEKEVLFMCGSVFRLITVIHDDLDFHIIKLRLCSEHDNDLRMVYEDLKEEYLSNARNLSLIDLGNILKDTNRNEQAEKYYIELMSTVDDDDPLIQRCLHNLAILRYKECNYNSALEYLQWALNLENVSSEREESFIRSIYNWMGNIYLIKQNFDRALHFYEEGLKHKSEIDPRDRLGEIKLYGNIASAYICQQRYELALEKHLECLAMKEDILKDSKHPMIAASHVNIGIVYKRLKQYQQAIDAFQRAFTTQCEVLGEDNFDVGITLYQLASVYNELGDYERAWEYYTQAIENFPENHSYRWHIQMALREIKDKVLRS